MGDFSAQSLCIYYIDSQHFQLQATYLKFLTCVIKMHDKQTATSFFSISLNIFFTITKSLSTFFSYLRMCRDIHSVVLQVIK